MARTESRTKCSTWRDRDFLALGKDAQRLYWVLYSQPTMSQCGVLLLVPRFWVTLARDETAQSVQDALDELSMPAPANQKPFVVVDMQTQELWVRGLIKSDGVCKNERIRKAAWSAWRGIVSNTIRSLAEAELLAHGPRESVEDIQSPQLDIQSLTGLNGNATQKPPSTKQQLTEADPGMPLTPASSSAPVPSITPLAAFAAAKATLVRPPREEEIATQRGGENRDSGLTRMAQLTKRLVDLCVGKNRELVTIESALVMRWAAGPVPLDVVEATIKRSAAQAEPPALPRAIAKMIHREAQAARIQLEPFTINRVLEHA
jgi:hypothetical protein